MDADALGALLAQEIEGEVAQHGQSASGMARTDAVLILAESEVKEPMHRVLEASVRAEPVRLER
jgi:hypothetical protein